MDTRQNDNPHGVKAGTATRRRGKAQVRKILDESRSLLINEGHAGLTLRKVARNLDISLGNLTYYFASKDQLIQALIADLLDEYHNAFLAEQARFPDDPHGRFLAYLEYLIADCKKPETRSVFFQIWGLATHSDIVHQLRDEIYTLARSDAMELIAGLNPEATVAELNALAAMFVSMIEGLHVIADLSDSVMQVPEDFESSYRDAIYGLMTHGVDPGVRSDVDRHLPKNIRRF